MAWLTGWSSKTLVASWTYSTRGQLWRLLPSVRGFLLLEDRNVESKTVSFACVDAITGKTRWQDLSFEERWWIGMEGVHEDVVFIHGYAAPDMPDHKKITALDVFSGKVLWTNAELKYLFAHEDAVYAARDDHDRRVFFELDLRDGAVLREIDDSSIGVLRSAVKNDRPADVHFPLLLPGTGQLAAQAPEAVDRIVRWIDNVEIVEFLEHDLHWIVGYHVRLQAASGRPLYRQHLAISRKDADRICFADVMTREALTCVPDMFFSMADHLYYIKERNSVSAVNLGRS